MVFSVRSFLLSVCLAGSLAAAGPTPVLLELFTSEGCSSCPPADRLLAKLHGEQPIRNVEVIVLSQHVDYWNRLGWVDPFSSAAMSERQSWYSTRWPTRVYTPQMVVDGEHEAVGGDGPRVVRLIRQAARRKKGKVAISYTLSEGGAGFRLDAFGLERAKKGKVMLAIVEDGLQIDVLKGENKGRQLRHAGVVRTLMEVGKTNSGEATWSGAATARFEEDWNRDNLRAVAFVQETHSRAVVAIGGQRLTE